MSAPLLHAFGPGDITCVAIIPGAAYVIDEVTDFSISTHFDKIPIRRIGHRLPVGWATGSGTVAGTLVCAQFTQGALWKLRRHAGAMRLFRDEPQILHAEGGQRAAARLDHHTAGILPAQLPPFHLMFVHTNESGQMAIARLYNVVISDHGETKGARNSFTEEMLQYQSTFYEQIRLHRSLTHQQLADLVGKPSNFFNDMRRNASLAEDLSDIFSDFGGSFQYGTGEIDLARYLHDETDHILRRAAQGQTTSIGIADQGDVVWTRSSRNVFIDPLDLGVPTTERQGDVPHAGEMYSSAIEDNVIVSDQNGVHQKTVGAWAYVVPRVTDASNYGLHISQLEPGPTGAPQGSINRPAIASLLIGVPTEVPARRYYDALLFDSGSNWDSMTYRPDSVRLSVSVSGAGLTINVLPRVDQPVIATESGSNQFSGSWKGHNIDLFFNGVYFSGTLLDVPVNEIEDGDTIEITTGLHAQITLQQNNTVLSVMPLFVERNIVIGSDS